MCALGEFGVQLSTDAVMHTPVESPSGVMEKLAACNGRLYRRSRRRLDDRSRQGLALRTDLPQIVLPTTYAGSEATPVLGETSGGTKSTINARCSPPRGDIYDVELTYGLPPAISLVSG